jgi:hypothetical protein
VLSHGFRTNEPDVIYQRFGKEVVAIYLPTGAYHSLDGVAGDIFLALSSGGAVAPQLASDLAARYDAPFETISQDLAALLGQMSDQSLIVPIDVPPSGSQAPAPGRDARMPYKAPSLQTYKDLQDLLLLDPVHDVSATVWPLPPQSPAIALESESFQCRIAGPHIIFEQFEEETVAMNVSNGAYYPLYGPAEDVFLLMTENPTLAEIRLALSTKYVAETQTLDQALRAYVRDLGIAGLICVDAAPPAACPPVSRELPLRREGTGVPFSTLSLQFLQDSRAAGPAAAGEGLRPGAWRYQVRQSGLLHAAAGGQMVAVDLESGRYLRLNEAASDVFMLLGGRPTLEEAAAALSAKYELPGREMMAAVMTFVWHLLRMDLVATVPADEAPPYGAPELCATERRVPFPGFDVTLHQDLKHLIRPLDVPRRSGTRPPAGRQSELCAMVGAYFEQVRAQQGATDRFYEIAGTRIRVRRAGGFDPEIGSACAHLSAAALEARPDLTIHVFECALTPKSDHLALLLETLHTNWSAVCGSRCEVPRYHSDRVAVVYHPGPDILSILDVESGQAWFLKRDSSPLPYWEIGSPFRYILHHWFASRGIQFVHAGAVGTGQGGVLLAGKGGSGKSTTSLVCARAGLLYAGDDYCLADPKSGFLYSLYDTGKLKGPDDLQRIPEVAGRSRNPDGFEQGGDGKAIFFLSDVWPDRVTRGFPLKAILIPRVSGEPGSSLEPCPPEDVLMALLPSTIAQLPSSGPADCERIAAFAASLPAYILHLGTDLEQIPPLVRKVLG